MTQSGRGDLVKRQGVPNVQRTAAAEKQFVPNANQRTALESMAVSNRVVAVSATGRPTFIHPSTARSLVRLGLASASRYTARAKSVIESVRITPKGLALIRAHTGKSWLGMDESQLETHVLALKRVRHDANLDKNTDVIEHIQKQLKGVAEHGRGPAAWRLQRHQALQKAITTQLATPGSRSYEAHLRDAQISDRLLRHRTRGTPLIPTPWIARRLRKVAERMVDRIKKRNPT